MSARQLFSDEQMEWLKPHAIEREYIRKLQEGIEGNANFPLVLVDEILEHISNEAVELVEQAGYRYSVLIEFSQERAGKRVVTTTTPAAVAPVLPTGVQGKVEPISGESKPGMLYGEAPVAVDYFSKCKAWTAWFYQKAVGGGEFLASGTQSVCKSVTSGARSAYESVITTIPAIPGKISSLADNGHALYESGTLANYLATVVVVCLALVFFFLVCHPFLVSVLGPSDMTSAEIQVALQKAQEELKNVKAHQGVPPETDPVVQQDNLQPQPPLTRLKSLETNFTSLYRAKQNQLLFASLTLTGSVAEMHLRALKKPMRSYKTTLAPKANPRQELATIPSGSPPHCNWFMAKVLADSFPVSLTWTPTASETPGPSSDDSLNTKVAMLEARLATLEKMLNDTLAREKKAHDQSKTVHRLNGALFLGLAVTSGMAVLLVVNYGAAVGPVIVIQNSWYVLAPIVMIMDTTYKFMGDAYDSLNLDFLV